MAQPVAFLMDYITTPDWREAIAPTLILVAVLLAIAPFVRREQTFVRVGAMALCFFFSWRYMIWRLTETIPWDGAFLDLSIGLIFVGTELLSLIAASASMFFLTRIKSRTKEVDANLPLLMASPVKPLVDILICTYNEDKDILERTIIGARATEYPNHRIWVCDDGKRSWLKELCEEHGVGYLTRADNAHAKAGNINAALKRLSALEQKPDFISILDADFVVTPVFITRSLALMREKDVGVVQTPQHFFNPDPVQHNLAIAPVWPDEQRFFFDIVMASKDAWNAAFCCGTSSLIRFSALMEINGFPTDSVTEDYLLSLRLRQRGYRTVYLNEKLTLGLAPEGLAEYCTQRSRWCLGFVQICRGPSGPLKFGNNLPLVDRVMLIETFLNWSATHFLRLLCVIVPALYLLFGIEAVHANAYDAVSHAAPFVATQMLVMAWLTRWRLMPFMTELYQLLPAVDLLKAVWAGMTKPQGQKFKVTAKGVAREHRAVQWPLLRQFLWLLALTAAGLTATFWLYPARALHAADGMALFWSWYNIILLTLACFSCIELGQRRKGDRFAAHENVRLHYNGRSAEWFMLDISVSGVRFSGAHSFEIGQEVEIELGKRMLKAKIARLTPDGFALAFAPTLEARVAAIQFVFSGRFSSEDAPIAPKALAKALIARVFH